MKANLKALKQDTRAVSPVVATLMLVLVAAASAVGLSIFLGDFQDSATEDVGTPDGTQKLTIGGSSTVYEFSLGAIPEFEAFTAQQGNPVKVELEKGGSGAGRQAVGNCLIDIGSSSSPVPESEKESWPDCDGNGQRDFGVELNIFKVATDAVVFVTLSNSHCTDGHVPALTQAQAYELYYKQARYGTGQGTVDTTKAVAPADNLTAAATTPVTWARLPTLELATGIISHPGSGNCATAGTNEVIVFDRKDPGGTSETFVEKLLGKKFGQLESAGITLVDAQQGDGNQGVLDAVEDHANGDDALFFTSYGYANAQGLTMAAFGKTTPIIPDDDDVGSETYDGTRPILYITAGKPTAVAQLYLDFVMNPHRNQLFAEAADFISIY